MIYLHIPVTCSPVYTSLTTSHADAGCRGALELKKSTIFSTRRCNIDDTRTFSKHPPVLVQDADIDIDRRVH